MPITRNLLGAGTGPQQALAVVGTTARGKIATGTTRADAYLISEDVTSFATVASGTGAALRTDSLENDVYTIINDGANALNIYPPPGGRIGTLSIDAPYSLLAGSFIDLQARGSGVFLPRENPLPALAATTGSGLVGHIASGVGAVFRWVRDKLRETVSNADYDTLQNAITAAGSRELLMTGVTAITTNTTFTCPVRMDGGASISVANGVTVTFAKKFTCGLHQCFTLTGTGTVVLSASYNLVGHPEWWGAVTGGPDCLAALTACDTAMPITQLQAADYFTSAKWTRQTPNRLVRGSTPQFTGSGTGPTRIVCTSATEDVIQVGPTAMPAGGINDFPQGIAMEDLQVTRSLAPTIASGCRGILNQYTLYARFKNVKSTESMTTWEFYGTVKTQCDDAQGFRSTAGSAAGTDYFRAMYVNGNASIGAGGGNASIYIRRPNCSMGGVSITDSIGIYCDGNFSDTYLLEPECVAVSTPIKVVGNGLTSNNSGNIDFVITNPICDSFAVNGIHIKDVGPYGIVKITNAYAAPTSAGTVVAGIRVESCTGSVTLNGTEIDGHSSASCIGLYATNSSKITSRGHFKECGGGGVVCSTVTNSRFEDEISNHNRAATTAMSFTSSSQCEIAPIVSGAAGKFAVGVTLVGTGNTLNEINLTSVDPACITGGQANKLTINGSQITVNGDTNSNRISGYNNTGMAWQIGTSLSIGGFGASSGLLNARSQTNRTAAVLQYVAADTQGVQIQSLRNRGTIGGDTALSSGDINMEITSRTWDGTANRTMAAIFTVADGGHGSGDTPGRIEFHTTLDGTSTATERLRIDNTGALIHRANATTIVDANSHLGLRSYTVATLPSAATASRLIYVSDGTANKRLAVSDGTNWRWPDGVIVS